MSQETQGFSLVHFHSNSLFPSYPHGFIKNRNLYLSQYRAVAVIIYLFFYTYMALFHLVCWIIIIFFSQDRLKVKKHKQHKQAKQ